VNCNWDQYQRADITGSCFYRCCLVNYTLKQKFLSRSVIWERECCLIKVGLHPVRKKYRKWMERLGISVSEEELHWRGQVIGMKLKYWMKTWLSTVTLWLFDCCEFHSLFRMKAWKTPFKQNVRTYVHLIKTLFWFNFYKRFILCFPTFSITY